MNAQQFANAVIQLLPRVEIPMAPENIQTAGQIYDLLGKMARGELILSEPEAPELRQDS